MVMLPFGSQRTIAQGLFLHYFVAAPRACAFAARGGLTDFAVGNDCIVHAPRLCRGRRFSLRCHVARVLPRRWHAPLIRQTV